MIAMVFYIFYTFYMFMFSLFLAVEQLGGSLPGKAWLRGVAGAFWCHAQMRSYDIYIYIRSGDIAPEWDSWPLPEEDVGRYRNNSAK